MDSKTKVDVPLKSLQERLQARARALLDKLSGQYSTEDLEAEVAILNELVDDFNERDRLMELLLDPTNSSTEVRNLYEVLPNERLTLAESRTELERLHEVSHRLIQQSVSLLAKAQRLFDQAEHQTSKYALEICGFCEGFGGAKDKRCPVCNGRRTVLVYQPAIQCPRCHGTGRAGNSSSMEVSERCVVCLGAGWALRLAEGQNRLT